VHKAHGVTVARIIRFVLWKEVIDAIFEVSIALWMLFWDVTLYSG
jgi:hypothetical protein